MRSRTTTTALGVGFVLVSATSLPLLLQPDYGQRYFWFVFVHWILGLVLLPLYYFVLASHLSTILGRYRTFLIFLFLIPVTFAGGIGPPFVSPWHNPLTVPIALLTFAIYWFLRRGPSIFGRKLRPLRLFQPLDPEEHPLTVWSGVGALVASWMILNTGFALTLADFKFANDKYFLHGPVAMLLFPLLAVHFAFWGRRYGRRPAAKTKVLLVGVAIASVALCGMSIYKNLAPLDYQRGETIVRVATQGVGTGPPKPLPAGALEVLDDSKPCQACHDEIASGGRSRATGSRASTSSTSRSCPRSRRISASRACATATTATNRCWRSTRCSITALTPKPSRAARESAARSATSWSPRRIRRETAFSRWCWSRGSAFPVPFPMRAT